MTNFEELLYWTGEDAVRGIRAVTSTPTRLEILRFVISLSEVSTADVMRAFRLSRNGVTKHLRALEEAGLIRARHSTHSRGSGPITYWAADRLEVTFVLDEIGRYLLGSDYF